MSWLGEGEREIDREGLRETYLDPSEGVRLWDLLEIRCDCVEREMLLPSLSLSSLSPSIAASNRLFRGPMSPFSSNTCLFTNRGIMMSQTLSSVRRL